MTTEFLAKPLPALRLAASTTTVPDQASVGAVVGPSFDAVADALQPNEGLLDVAVATYEMTDDGVHVVVGYAYDGEVRDGFEIVEVPAAEDALTTVHHGSMATIGAAWHRLHGEIVSRGQVPAGPGREVYVVAEPDVDQDKWVTELQQPVAPA